MRFRSIAITMLVLLLLVISVSAAEINTCGYKVNRIIRSGQVLPACNPGFTIDESTVNNPPGTQVTYYKCVSSCGAALDVCPAPVGNAVYWATATPSFDFCEAEVAAPVPKKSRGDSCTQAYECSSNVCYEGVCSLTVVSGKDVKRSDIYAYVAQTMSRFQGADTKGLLDQETVHINIIDGKKYTAIIKNKKVVGVETGLSGKSTIEVRTTRAALGYILGSDDKDATALKALKDKTVVVEGKTAGRALGVKVLYRQLRNVQLEEVVAGRSISLAGKTVVVQQDGDKLIADAGNTRYVVNRRGNPVAATNKDIQDLAKVKTGGTELSSNAGYAGATPQELRLRHDPNFGFFMGGLYMGPPPGAYSGPPPGVYTGPPAGGYTGPPPNVHTPFQGGSILGNCLYRNMFGGMYDKNVNTNECP